MKKDKNIERFETSSGISIKESRRSCFDASGIGITEANIHRYFLIPVHQESEAQGRSYMKNKFDAVKFQRKAREELSKKYSANRETFVWELKEKYGHLRQHKT